jgi:tetratricopeptide (TPR) repeat protein
VALVLLLAVAGAFRERSTSAVEDSSPPLPRPEARDDYLVARSLLRAERFESCRRAIPMLERVTRADSTFAPGFAYLGTARFFTGDLGGAEAAALAALAIDPEDAEALVVQAHVLALRDWKWPAARRALDRALAVAPRERSVLHSQAFFLALEGRPEAIRWMIRAQRIDPTSAAVNCDLGLLYFWAGRPDDALAQCRRALAIAEEPWLREAAFDAAIRAGRQDEAERYARELLTDWGAPAPEPGSPAAEAYRRFRVEATRKLIARGDTTRYCQLALYLADLGRGEEALDALERAVRHPSILLPTVAVDPRMDALRGTRRYRAVLERMGLAPVRDRGDPANS